jgi:hypothetical protein
MSVHKWAAGGVATFTALVTALAFTAGPATASFSNFTLSSSFGAFHQPGSIAIDETTGDVYVYDRLSNGEAVLQKFDGAGNPVDFSALGTNTIALGEGNENQIAVDNSSGPAKGDIYVADASFGIKSVLIYGSDGKALGELQEPEGLASSRPCGVAVGRAGDVYSVWAHYYIYKYSPSANPVTSGDFVDSLTNFADGSVCNVGVDVGGNVYSVASNGVFKFTASQFNAGEVEGTQVASNASTLAVANAFSGEVFVDHQGEIVQYDPSGNVLSTFGSSVQGVGVNAKNGKLYISNSASKTVEIWQGIVAVPSLQTDSVTNLDAGGSATLNGEVEPEETPVETCAFQYGTSVSYGSSAPCAQATPLTGGGIVPISADLSGVTLNTVYHYRLSAENENGTAYGDDKTFIVLVAPRVEDQAPTASAITRAAATLTGSVDPEQGDTAYHFDIGVTEEYGASTPVVHTGAGILGDIAVNQRVGELLPDTTYHYRLVALNVAGRVVGADHTFTTGPATPPVAVTGASSGVAENTATISGTVDTSGLPTTYGFEIGTSTDYGPATGLGSVGAGLSETPVSLALTGLLPGTTYHYRLTATNLDGTSYGADETFTTAVFASTFATPPAPLPFVEVPAIPFPPEQKSGVVKKKAGKAKGKKKVKRHGKAKAKKNTKHKKKK